jgi:CheY-like chemotaxis protein
VEELAWPYSILAVDDELLNIKILKMLFKNMNIKADGELCPLRAWDKLVSDAGEYDFVTMDEVMPKMRGSELVSKWREFEIQHGRNRLPIVMITANGSKEEQAKYVFFFDFCPERLLKFFGSKMGIGDA